MSSSESSERKTRPDTIDPEVEPECVGFHSEPTATTCENWRGEFVEDIGPCGGVATHTCVVKDENGLHEIAMCDDCGNPDGVAENRRWSA